MLSAVNVRHGINDVYPSLVHIDGTMRVQIVKDVNSTAFHILSEYERITGKFLLINTSFNGKGEPIVETIEDAFSSAKRIGISYILCNGKLVYI